MMSTFPVGGCTLYKGEMSGFWSITVTANWRVIFRFVGADVELVNYLDYH